MIRFTRALKPVPFSTICPLTEKHAPIRIGAAIHTSSIFGGLQRPMHQRPIAAQKPRAGCRRCAAAPPCYAARGDIDARRRRPCGRHGAGGCWRRATRPSRCAATHIFRARRCGWTCCARRRNPERSGLPARGAILRRGRGHRCQRACRVVLRGAARSCSARRSLDRLLERCEDRVSRA